MSTIIIIDDIKLIMVIIARANYNKKLLKFHIIIQSSFTFLTLH